MNFDYMRNAPGFAQLYTYCCEAEEFALSKPNISVASARKAMEFIVKMIYSAVVGDPQGKTVFDMLSDYNVKQYLGDQTLPTAIHYIRKMGNAAVHESTLTVTEAVQVLKMLHFLVGEVAVWWQVVPDYPAFVMPAHPETAQPKPAESPKEKEEIAPELCALYAEKMRTTRFSVAHDRDENENKKLFLHASLREAGWPLVNRDNASMPSAVAIDCKLDRGDSVDYVLCGRDNKPLAIIEYTTTVQNLVEGRTKGIDKANQLAKKYGYKPVVYYTNGQSVKKPRHSHSFLV